MEKLHITSEYNQQDSDYIRRKLVEFNGRHLSEKDVNFHDEKVSLLLRDEDHKQFFLLKRL